MHVAQRTLRRKFQLTPSRRATSLSTTKISIGVFQLTPSRRATASADVQIRGAVFQLTPSRRATSAAGMFGLLTAISTHALTEGDLCCHPRRFSHVYFNSRPHGGRRYIRWLWEFWMNFNSRPHGGRQRKATGCSKKWNISTHALTEGDQNTDCDQRIRKRISTHALTEGDT